MNIEQERAEFEAWRRKHYDYADLCAFEIEFSFDAFQAGRAALRSQDREDAARIEFLEKEWFYRNTKGVWAFGFSETWEAGQHDSLREAIDHARRVEGEG